MLSGGAETKKKSKETIYSVWCKSAGYMYKRILCNMLKKIPPQN